MATVLLILATIALTCSSLIGLFSLHLCLESLSQANGVRLRFGALCGTMVVVSFGLAYGSGALLSYLLGKI